MAVEAVTTIHLHPTLHKRLPRNPRRSQTQPDRRRSHLHLDNSNLDQAFGAVQLRLVLLAMVRAITWVIEIVNGNAKDLESVQGSGNESGNEAINRQCSSLKATADLRGSAVAVELVALRTAALAARVRVLHRAVVDTTAPALEERGDAERKYDSIPKFSRF